MLLCPCTCRGQRAVLLGEFGVAGERWMGWFSVADGCEGDCWRHMGVS